MMLLRTILDLLPGSIYRHRLKGERDDHLSPRVVDRDADVVVEGFPRSANTFVVYYLALAIPRLQIAHHVHSWQQFLLGRVYRIPSILLMRDPDACVASLMTKYPGRAPSGAYVEYVVFHLLSYPFVDQIIPFETAIDAGFLAQFANGLGTTVGKVAQGVDLLRVEGLVERRTGHKNSTTVPPNVAEFSLPCRLARGVARRLYQWQLSSRRDGVDAGKDPEGSSVEPQE